MRPRRALTWILALGVATTACATRPHPVVIADEGGQTVAVMYDRKVGTGHSHPATLTVEQMTHVLDGLRVHNRDTIGLGGLIGGRPTGRAFSTQQIATLAPRLVEALAVASPDHLATFYLVTIDPRLGRVITSGGLFVRGQQLHIMLANFHTPPSAAPFEGMAAETDSKDDPLFPIARFRYTVGFEPPDAIIPNRQAERASSVRYVDESKILVLDLTRLGHHATAPALPGPAPSSAR